MISEIQLELLLQLKRESLKDPAKVGSINFECFTVTQKFLKYLRITSVCLHNLEKAAGQGVLRSKLGSVSQEPFSTLRLISNKINLILFESIGSLSCREAFC